MIKVNQKVIIKGGFGLEAPTRVRVDSISMHKGQETITYTDWDGADRWAYVSQIIDFNPTDEKAKAPTNFDAVQSLDCIWDKLHKYRDLLDDMSVPNDEEWDDICTAMSWIEDECGLERKEGILEPKQGEVNGR